MGLSYYGKSGNRTPLGGNEFVREVKDLRAGNEGLFRLADFEISFTRTSLPGRSALPPVVCRSRTYAGALGRY